LLQVKQIFAEDGQMAVEILRAIGELEKREKQCENVQRRQENVSSKVFENIPSRINALLQRSSPWICQSLGPEISRCYRAGGDAVVVQYAHAKLRHIRKLTQQRCDHRTSTLSVDGHADFIREPKRSTSDGFDVEARELECGMYETVAEEEYEIRDTVEEEREVEETEEEEVEDRETAGTEYGMRETGAELEAGKVVDREFLHRESVAGIEDKETVEGEFDMRETSEEENELEKSLGETYEIAESLDLENEVRERESDEMMETLRNKGEAERIFQHGVRSVNVHVKRTKPQNINKQSADSETPSKSTSTSTSNVIAKTRSVSTPVVADGVNSTMSSSDICAIHNETVCI
jgi:hypothetical protein